MTEIPIQFAALVDRAYRDGYLQCAREFGEFLPRDDAEQLTQRCAEIWKGFTPTRKEIASG